MDAYIVIAQNQNVYNIKMSFFYQSQALFQFKLNTKITKISHTETGGLWEPTGRLRIKTLMIL